MGNINLRGDEFMRKILSGERDFRGIRLEDYFDAEQSGHYTEVSEYLQKQDFQKQPIDISGSEMPGIRLANLCLPYLKARNAVLKSSCFDKSTLTEADFGGAIMPYARIRDANAAGIIVSGADAGSIEFTHSILLKGDFSNAKLEDAIFAYSDARFSNFEYAVLKKARMWNADISHSRMKEADISLCELDFAEMIHVKDLMLCKGIETAIFRETGITEGMHSQVKERLKDANLHKRANTFVIDYSG